MDNETKRIYSEMEIPNNRYEPTSDTDNINIPSDTAMSPRIESGASESYSQVTSIGDLQTYSKGQVVRLPDFAEDQPFIARVRRPSMLMLAKSGKIPNQLLKTAQDLFVSDVGNSDNEDMLKDMFDVCEVIADATLIEPSYADIRNAGLELSDDQLLAIFNYSQNGAQSLEKFR